MVDNQLTTTQPDASVPPPIRLPGGQAAAPRSASSRSLAVQRSGTLVSKRMPGGLKLIILRR